jgi:hypothetical protein
MTLVMFPGTRGNCKTCHTMEEQYNIILGSVDQSFRSTGEVEDMLLGQ